MRPSVKQLLIASFFLVSVNSPTAPPVASKKVADAWARLPFTAWEWARQTQLPYREVPLKKGGTMPVQKAYDLFLQAGQPEYPDMDTPGLVTPEEIAEQLRLSRNHK